MDSVNTGHHKPHKMNPTIKTAWSGFKVFAANSNLHGLKYFSEKISVFEKLFWAATFIASIVLCSILINNVWYKWQTSPVIVSFNEEVVPVWKVPFPAITICPQQKIKQAVFNFTESLYHVSKHEKMEESDIKLIDDMSAVCYHEFPKIPLGRIDNKNASSVHNIYSVAPKAEDVFFSCIWRETEAKCRDIFKEVLTNEGVCFTFNTQKAEDMFNMDSLQRDYIYLNTTTETKEWSMDKGYTGKNIKEAYPRIGRQNGAQPDLKVILKIGTADADYMCSIHNNGFKVYMHHPTDMPQASLHYYAVLPGQVTSLATKFNMVSTSDTLQSYSAKIRQCYFPSDRQLKYFKTYTQSNCELECVSNYTYKACNCVWFHMPHDNSSQICGNQKSFCVLKAKENLSFDEIDIGEAKSTACNCLPACDNVSYDAEMHKSDFDYIKLLESLHVITNISHDLINNVRNGGVYSRFLVHFKDSRFVAMRRSELFGTTDFLANCGGLLGLFMGFSFLSIVEIFYFSFIKVLYKIWSKNNKIGSASTNMNEIAFTSKTDK